jgi:hypothetical protein
MNKHITNFNEIILPLSREIDREIAGDIEKELTRQSAFSM